MYFLLRGNAPAKEKINKILCLIIPFSLLVGGWMAWKIFYYGDIFPNTFYAKVFSVNRGLQYLCLFFNSYLLLPVCFIFILAIIRIFKKPNLPIIIIGLSIILWLLYLVKVGGDFMEFRFMVPILPLLFIWISWTIFTCIRQEKIQAAFVFFIMIGSLHHFYTFEKNSAVYAEKYGIETISDLDAHISNIDQNWGEIGRVIGKCFNYSQDITIATTAAGAIPYYSRLTTVDMLGLNDKRIARQEENTTAKPGHQKTATLGYLIERKVNILIGHPWIKINGDPSMGEYSQNDIINYLNEVSFMSIKNSDELPLDSKIIEIPIDQSHNLVVIYLVRSAMVDQAIREYNWQAYPIIRTIG